MSDKPSVEEMLDVLDFGIDEDASTEDWQRWREATAATRALILREPKVQALIDELYLAATIIETELPEYAHHAKEMRDALSALEEEK